MFENPLTHVSVPNLIDSETYLANIKKSGIKQEKDSLEVGSLLAIDSGETGPATARAQGTKDHNGICLSACILKALIDLAFS